MMKKIFVFLMLFVPLAALLGACQVLSGLDLGRENIPCGPLHHVGQPTAEHPQVITLTVWMASDVNMCNMASVSVWAAQKRQWIGVEAQRFEVSSNQFHNLIDQAYAANSAPDIYMVGGRRDVRQLLNQGKILPIDECIATNNEFSAVIPQALEEVTINGNISAAPIDAGFNILYFDKRKLRELGWTDTEIQTLPDRIGHGDFVLADLLKTAKQAIELGIVEPGYGFIAGYGGADDFLDIYYSFGGEIYDQEGAHFLLSIDAFEKASEFYRVLFANNLRLSNFSGYSKSNWFSAFLRTDALAKRRALFWHSSTADVNEFDLQVVYGSAASVSSHYFEEVGVSLLPSGLHGEQGGAVVYFQRWVLNANLASSPDKLEAACKIMATSLLPEVSEPHLLARGRAPVVQLKNSDLVLRENEFQAMIYPFWEYAWWRPYPDEQTDTYNAIISDIFERLTTDEISVGLAKAEIIAKLNHKFGTDIEIRP